MAALNLKAARADGRDLRVKPRPVPPAGRLRPAEPTAGVRHETRVRSGPDAHRLFADAHALDSTTVVCAASGRVMRRVVTVLARDS